MEVNYNDVVDVCRRIVLQYIPLSENGAKATWENVSRIVAMQLGDNIVNPCTDGSVASDHRHQDYLYGIGRYFGTYVEAASCVPFPRYASFRLGAIEQIKSITEDIGRIITHFDNADELLSLPLQRDVGEQIYPEIMLRRCILEGILISLDNSLRNTGRLKLTKTPTGRFKVIKLKKNGSDPFSIGDYGPYYYWLHKTSLLRKSITLGDTYAKV